MVDGPRAGDGKPRIIKQDLGGGVHHPAPYSKVLLPVIAAKLTAGWRVLDPFAGTGRIHDLRDLIAIQTVGIEIEREWAALHPDTVLGSALALPFPDGVFDAIVTSPCYGNRMADNYNAKDPESRRSYRSDLGHALHRDSSAGLQWGDAYRGFHRRAWDEAIRVLRPEGRFVLNIKDHIRNGTLQRVSAWHVETLSQTLDLDPDLSQTVRTRSMRAGQNRAARVPHESVFVFTKPAK